MTDTLEILDGPYVKYLAPRVSAEDRRDLIHHGGSPKAALESALLLDLQGEGHSWVWLRDDLPMGAFGWTEAGGIWSLWTNLSISQQRFVLKWTPSFVRALVRDARQTLGNLVHEDNSRTIAWLKASKCFNLDLDKRAYLTEGSYIPFSTKPMRELWNV